jgi:hypothetical protein
MLVQTGELNDEIKDCQHSFGWGINDNAQKAADAAKRVQEVKTLSSPGDSHSD